MRTRGWRRIGTAVVRWPGPILVVTVAVALIGLLALPGYKTSYDRAGTCPRSAGQRRLRGRRTALLPGPAQSRAVDDRDRSRHAQPGRHARAGAGRQGRLAHPRHRPGAVDHPAAGHADQPQLDPVSDQRTKRQPDHEPQLPAGPRRRPAQTGRRDRHIHRHPQAATRAAATGQRRHPRADPGVPRHGRDGEDLRDKIANFDDFFRPLRNYFYWEPHCFDIPICAALRSVFDALDGIDALTDQLRNRSRRAWTN